MRLCLPLFWARETEKFHTPFFLLPTMDIIRRFSRCTHCVAPSRMRDNRKHNNIICSQSKQQRHRFGIIFADFQKSLLSKLQRTRGRLTQFFLLSLNGLFSRKKNKRVVVRFETHSIIGLCAGFSKLVRMIHKFVITVLVNQFLITVSDINS